MIKTEDGPRTVCADCLDLVVVTVDTDPGDEQRQEWHEVPPAAEWDLDAELFKILGRA